MIARPFQNLLMCFVLLAGSVIPGIAQPGIPHNPPTPMDAPVPITGVAWLLIAGGAMGGYKLLKKNQADADESEQ